ncbi:hypothetical protein BKA83DRAFT_4232666 [Pisolithus microcarpus]|nr:hypothetical protein BKA83DRAFT_4343139 [Pisolithus microcarpus]KAI6027684.1 hypothetical protein BKA83DRAFT_4232666 [Pisolithus microcarpus]
MARQHHEAAKDVIKDGSGREDAALEFKKPFQTVSRTTATDHDIHEDYIKDPPQESTNASRVPTSKSTPGIKEGAYEEEALQSGVLGDEDTGRMKQIDVEGETLNESSMHPRTTPGGL